MSETQSDDWDDLIRSMLFVNAVRYFGNINYKKKEFLIQDIKD